MKMSKPSVCPAGTNRRAVAPATAGGTRVTHATQAHVCEVQEQADRSTLRVARPWSRLGVLAGMGHRELPGDWRFLWLEPGVVTYTYVYMQVVLKLNT